MSEAFRAADIEKGGQPVERLEFLQGFGDRRRGFHLRFEVAVPRSPHDPGQDEGKGHRGPLRLAAVVDAGLLQRRIGQSLHHLTRRHEGRRPGRMPVNAAPRGHTRHDVRPDEIEKLTRRYGRRHVAVEDHGIGDRRWR